MSNAVRALTEQERRLVDRLLAPVEGVAAPFDAQLAKTRVRDSCDCGCPSIEFVGDVAGLCVDDESSELLVDAAGTTADGHDVGIILWRRGDQLTALEVYAYEDLPNFGLPELDSIEAWDAPPECR